MVNPGQPVIGIPLNQEGSIYRAEFYFQFLLSKKFKLADNLASLRNTKLDWITNGMLCEDRARGAVCAVVSEDDQWKNWLKNSGKSRISLHKQSYSSITRL